MDKYVWRSFHKAYLLGGLLDAIFRTAAERDISLTAASAHVHGKSVEDVFTWDVFQKIWDDLSWYDQGLAILRKFNPNLSLGSTVVGSKKMDVEKFQNVTEFKFLA